MAGLCDRCGAPGSPSGRAASCPACLVPAASSALIVAAAAWLPALGDPGTGCSLGDVLRSYRQVNDLTQQQAQVGMDEDS